MPKAYVVVHALSGSDHKPPQAYIERFRGVLAQHQGKVIIASYDLVVREGELDFKRLVTIEFADMQTASGFLDQYSIEVEPLLGQYERRVFVVEGVS